jgi:hypothetical protein
MLNSMQAYQLSAALTPTFLANTPPGTQANALGMQYQGAQQGVSAELYKKALKKQNDKSLLDTVLGGAQTALGFVDPVKSLVGGISGMAGAGAAASNVAGAALSNGEATVASSYDPTTGAFYNPSKSVAAQDPTASMADASLPATDGTTAAPATQGGGGNSLAPIAAAAGGAALLKGVADRGEANMAQQSAVDMALKGVADPRKRMQIMQTAQMGPKEFQSMQPLQRMVAASGLLDAGIPLTKTQVRGIPHEERKLLQKHYGPELVPMTTLDKLNSFIDAYEQTAGPGRLVKPYNGMEMYLP